jgi:hypothetical protein
MGISHDMSPYLFSIDDIITLLEAELNDKQLMICTYFRRPNLPPQTEKLEIKYDIITIFKISTTVAPQHSTKHRAQSFLRSHLKNSKKFMEPNGSLLYSQ